MSRLRSGILPLLLVVTIVVITGFQLFWLKQNYNNEKRTLEVKTGFNFRESVYNLQATHLSQRFGLPVPHKDSFQMEILEGDTQHDKLIRYNKTRDVVSMVNIMRRNEKDSLSALSHNEKTTVQVYATDGPRIMVDSAGATWNQEKSQVRFIKLLNGIDSVGDTLKIADIKKATSILFAKEKINVPFTVLKKDSASIENPGIGDPPEMDEVTVGFSKPVTYKLELGNTFPYLFRKLLSPVLFSLFLIGVTVASFIVLYRSLLQQKRLAILKDDFISNVTHELKTPIATVNVALEAMKSFNAMNDPVKTREYLDISQGELQRLSLLVDKVLRISMFENNAIQLNIEEVDLHSLVKEVAVSMRLQFDNKSAIVHIERNGSETSVKADRLHMMSVVYNLFDNALKYSGDKPVIDVKVEDKGDAVEMIFADNGMGIHLDYRERVFEKFFRVPHGDTHNVKGYGLGLSYVSQIIQQHKGKINMESEEGKGTTFFIYIPKTNGRS